MPLHENHKSPDKESRRALNTPENALKAVAAGRECISALEPGKVWRHRAPHGIEIKASLTLDGAPVVIIHFSPDDGSVLPKGLHGFTEGTSEVIATIKKGLKEMPARITVLEGAEFREPEFCWAVPLVVDGRIVSHLKVSSDGSRVLADKKAIEESQKAAE
ncbi:MAG: hypothetical protein DKT66_02440 [Candidatus Melainabacteria bacterium]|nr:MAG: hypothetical protein DKT66_02440 [Candidatus Melainabacteria bacterium]